MNKYEFSILYLPHIQLISTTREHKGQDSKSSSFWSGGSIPLGRTGSSAVLSQYYFIGKDSGERRHGIGRVDGTDTYYSLINIYQQLSLIERIHLFHFN